MRYWLMKTEPQTFGLEQLAAAPRRTATWDGVRNYQARNMLRDDFSRGDQAFLYHSSCETPGIVAIMDVVRGGHPDPTATDSGDAAQPRWYAVDVRLRRRLGRTITLADLRAHANRALRGMVLLRPGNRLSVMPVTPAQWKFILSLE